MANGDAKHTRFAKDIAYGKFRYRPHNTWRETLMAREEALRNLHMKAAERWSEHTKHPKPLVVGDTVRIQPVVTPVECVSK